MSVTPFIMFNDQAEEAVELYTTVFRNSKRLGPMAFELEGQEFFAMNGGPTFSFADGISLMVSCDSQEDLDYYWGRLTAEGEEGRCGWLKDKFGISWQIVPAGLGELLGDPDPARAARARQAMMDMSKLDLAALQAAASG